MYVSGVGVNTRQHCFIQFMLKLILNDETSKLDLNFLRSGVYDSVRGILVIRSGAARKLAKY